MRAGPSTRPPPWQTPVHNCLAGVNLLKRLNIKPLRLQKRVGLRHVADLTLKSLGSCVCRINLGGLSTRQEVYFVSSSKVLFLSLGACKELRLVHTDFLHLIPLVAAVTANSVITGPSKLPARLTMMPFLPVEEYTETNNCRKSFTRFRTPYASLPKMTWRNMTRPVPRQPSQTGVGRGSDSSSCSSIVSAAKEGSSWPYAAAAISPPPKPAMQR